MKSGEVLQIGGGNIGRALVGEVMHEAGLHVTFADVNEELITHFNNEHGYPVRVVSLEGARNKYIDDVDAISSQDETAMIGKIVEADIITTAVGAAVLPKVAPVLAKGLMKRLQIRPSDKIHVAVIACENVENNSETLKDHILTNLPDDEWRARVINTISFPNCAVDRIVPDTRDDSGHPLMVTTEDYYQLAVDQTALKSHLPAIPGVQSVDDLEAVLAQKLFTLNGAHAAVAYWGYLRGYDTIDEAMGDPDIDSLAQGLMQEVGAVIERHYPSISAAQQQAFAQKTLRRFKNPYLQDKPIRVGRDPMRKLASTDRLLKPAILAHRDGLSAANLGMAVLGGFRFDTPGDQQATEVHQRIVKFGIEPTIVAVTGLHAAHPIVRQTAASYRLTNLVEQR